MGGGGYLLEGGRLISRLLLRSAAMAERGEIFVRPAAFILLLEELFPLKLSALTYSGEGTMSHLIMNKPEVPMYNVPQSRKLRAPEYVFLVNFWCSIFKRFVINS